MSKKIIPIDDWLLVYPLVQDERVEGGIILPKGTNSDDVDVSKVRVEMLPSNNVDENFNENIFVGAILVIPKMDGLLLRIEEKAYKLIKMDRVIAYEEIDDNKW